MKQLLKYLFLTVFSLLIINPALYATDADEGLPGYFLDLGMGARALSMGRSYTSVADDFSAIYWNQAGLSKLNSAELSVTHVSLFEDTLYDCVGFAKPARNNFAYGVGFVQLYTGGVVKRDENNVPGGEITDRNQALLLSGSYLFNEKLSFGTGFKVVNKSFDDINVTWYGLDASAIYSPLSNLNIGLNLQNIYYFNNNEEIPRNVKFGISYKLLDNKLLVSADVDNVSGQSTKIHSGIEYMLINILRLRGGYDKGDLSAGFGVSIKDYEIDYALLNHSLGVSHRATFVYRFWEKSKIEKKTIEAPAEGMKIIKKKEETLSDYQVSAKVIKEIPTSVYHLFEAKNISVINVSMANNTKKEKRFKISYRIGLRNPAEIRKVILPGNTTKYVDLIPSVLQEDIKKIGTVPTPDTIFVDVEELLSRERTKAIFSDSYQVILLPYDQFVQELIDAKGEKHELLDTLASWVTSNDRKLEKIISKASEKGLLENPPVKIVGFLPPHIFTKAIEDSRSFEEKDKDYMSQIKLLYNVLKNDYNIVYLNKPMVYKQSQRINLPSATLETKGNCIELSVLFASLLESIEISPILVLFPDEGHAAVGWKVADSNKQAYHLIETNVFGESFDRTIAKGNDLITEHNLKEDFDKGISFDENGIYRKGTNVLIIDIRKIRSQIPPSPYIP